jgi:hypothetical protein
VWSNWNLEPEVAKSIAELRQIQTREQASLRGNSADSRFHNAVGHDHSGAYYPVVLTSLDPLEEILQKGSAWARFVVVNILFNLYCSFYPVTGDLLQDKVLGEELQTRIARLVPVFRSLSQADEPDAQTARELVEAIEQGLAHAF